jgi:DNA-binding NarL/FixJ family response regulator
MPSPKATHLRLTIEKKIEILGLVEKGKSKKDIALQYGIAPSTLSTFRKEKKQGDHLIPRREGIVT